MHVIIRIDRRPVEVQVRTELQHLWAEISEKLADMAGDDVKYGGGPKEVRQPLVDFSDLVAQVEGMNPAERMQYRETLRNLLAGFLAVLKGVS